MEQLRERIDAPEWLDEGNADPAEVRRSLDDLRRLNDLLFGTRATLAPIQARIAALPKPVTVVDVATGSGQMAQRLAIWAAREWQSVRIFGVDLLTPHLNYAREWNQRCGASNVSLITADALTLPFANGGVDIVTASLFLHHLNATALEQFFAECRRVARVGVVMSDLWRHPLPFTLYKGLEPLLVRSPITRYDSRVSFRRGYTPREMQAIAEHALPGARVRLEFPSFRWLLEWWRT